MRLVVRLAVVFLLVSLGPLAGLGYVVIGLIERSVTRQVKANHEDLAGVARGSLRLYLDTARGKLKTIAAILDAQGAGKGAKFSADNLNSMLEPPDIFVELTVYRVGEGFEQLGQARQTQRNPQQEEYGEAQRNYRGQQMAANALKQVQDWAASLTNDHPMVKLAHAGNEVFSEALKLPADGPAALPMAVPLGTRDDMLLVADLDFTPVWKHFETIAGEREIQLIDGAGNTLLSSRPRPLAGDLLEARVAAGHADWAILVREPRSAAFAPLAQARMQVAGWLGGGAALSILLSFALAAFILRPVQSLATAAERLKAGDLTARTGVDRDDELGRLAKSFDQMAAALQQLDQVKSEFVAHVSHELRTPLTSMTLAVGNLLDGVVGPVDDRQKEVLRRIREDIARLIRMVNELLDMAKLEAGKVSLAKEPVDLAKVAAAAVDTLRPIAERKGVRLHVAGGPAPVEADRAKLHEIVVNLVDNAIKFTAPAGRVDVEVAGRTLVVRDTGCGIAPERLPRIFDKFAQVNADTGIPGAGLGLSITRKLVELHGGSISVESAVGRGTAFAVVI
jgi:signal transduction histidine kinase